MRIPQSKQDKGFTLIELLVVVVIIGILAAIAIPVFLNQRQKAADAGAKSDLKNAATAQEAFLTANPDGGYTDNSADELGDNGFVATSGVTVTVESAGTEGYCMTGLADNGSQTWVYDSGDGGLQAADVQACVNDYTDAAAG